MSTNKQDPDTMPALPEDDIEPPEAPEPRPQPDKKTSARQPGAFCNHPMTLTCATPLRI